VDIYQAPEFVWIQHDTQSYYQVMGHDSGQHTVKKDPKISFIF